MIPRRLERKRETRPKVAVKSGKEAEARFFPGRESGSPNFRTLRGWGKKNLFLLRMKSFPIFIDLQKKGEAGTEPPLPRRRSREIKKTSRPLRDKKKKEIAIKKGHRRPDY